LTPDGGTVTHAEGLRVVYFDQARAALDLAVKLKDYLGDGSDAVVYRGRSLHIASYARRFQFRPEQLELLLGDLSGGEQARALVAKLMLAPADVLLLDEPTNDLDIPTLEALEDSLADFPGAVVLVTHDRYFMDQVAGLVVGLDGDGGATLYADYAQWERARGSRVKAPAPAPERGKPSEARADTAGTAPAKTRAKRLSYLDQREYDGMEAAIAVAEADLEAKRAAAAAPEIATAPARLAEVCAAFEAAEAAVERLYARWAELEGKLK
jgi:ATP-binding cassette subfamily F protein uup